MNRREAISAVALLLGGTVVGADLLVSCTPQSKKVDNLFDKNVVAELNEVADTILPATSTPGAKAANVGEFMSRMVTDCYTKDDQEVFKKGISQLNEASDKKYSKPFMELNAKQRTELLTGLDAEQKKYMASKKEDAPSHYFRMMKELTLLGYFTSEIGATQALRYVPVPGRYDGCIDYKKGDRAWAT
ncbi:gluconate 2-dehydrogenase subunit 3 family protein [Pontibacter liquoris]|uniref:gluconate 2-dehydrogenase subunit 3 family protein n=1 Tax=Pontibacter liquoris TaxID=2905677 RepID=UPI001FA708DF|nr:gluconate 2-dehydrogenase subunit 3 family protein [Pontibacter liquoris]